MMSDSGGLGGRCRRGQLVMRGVGVLLIGASAVE